jgi:transposase-like protein
MNMTMRKVIKNKRMFPTENSVFKILYLVSLKSGRCRLKTGVRQSVTLVSNLKIGLLNICK